MIFFEWVVKVSQGSPLHVVDCTNVCNGEIGVGSGNGGVGSGNGVIRSKVGYSKLAERDLGEDKKKFL
jgi:hypothetical protein